MSISHEAFAKISDNRYLPLIKKYKTLIEKYEEDGKGEMANDLRGALKDSNEEPFVNQLYRLSKEISQLIAKSWIIDDEGDSQFKDKKHDRTAEQIKEILLGETKAKTKEEKEKKAGELRELLNDNCTDDIEEILGKDTIFEINTDSFLGSLADMPASSEKIFKLTIGYPPKPSSENLTDKDLKDWIKDTENYTPPHPYIPVTW